jgi:glycosyltransferase involved in cell wall biosynthesis
MYLGNLDPRKGPLQAIEAAAALDLPIVLAGGSDEGYYEAAIRPHIDGQRVRYVGAVDVAERNRLLAGAGALLYPLVDPEPFGLVMIEAMACGTPVAAVGIGAVPEIVDVGCTGQLIEHAGQLAQVIPATLELDRAAVRDRARVRFNHHRMTRDYERVYRAAIAQRRPAAA